MSRADTLTAARTDWPLSNPWPWALTGLGASAAALLWVRVFDDRWTGVRFALLLIGLLAAGVSVVLRCRSARPAYLEELPPARRGWALLGLSAAGGLLAVSALGLLLAGLCGMDVPWTNDSLAFLCVLVVPGGALLAGYSVLHLRNGKPVSGRAETAALLVLAAVTSFLACWALYLDWDRELQWDTLRLFLAMLAAVAFLAAPLVLLPTRARRLVVSVLVLYHIGGILTAAIASPPSPWLAGRVWNYFYRPYLEFMYLNNAYHFYAPEPGPSWYLWYRIEYERANGDRHWHWGQVPEMDEKGNPQYAMSIQYQRRLALLETVNRTDSAPPEIIFNGKEGRWVSNPIYLWRQVNSPQPPEVMIGQPRPKQTHSIPFHPDISGTGQYRPSSFVTAKLIECFARHLARRPTPYPDDKVVNIKLYRVTHVVPPPELVKREEPPFDPLSPHMFLPFFQGTFDKDGKILDMPYYDADGKLLQGDPLVYWLLPILKENPNDPNSAIRNYMLLHAGDSKWVRYPGRKEWSEERPDPRQREPAQ